MEASQSATLQQADVPGESSGLSAEAIRPRANEAVVDLVLARRRIAPGKIADSEDEANTEIPVMRELDVSSLDALSTAHLAYVETLAIRNLDSRGVGPAISFPPQARPRRPTATLHALQEWEGHVVEMGDNKFVAHLTDLTAGHSHASEEATIPMAEVSGYDRHRMAVGGIFRWVIGYEQSVEGTRTRVSRIVFRDLPRMTASDFREGEEWAHRVLESWKT